MAGEIELTSNYSDLRTDNGVQFEFHCNRCGNRYRTEFDTWSMSAATNVPDGASSFLGGIFSQGADAAQRVKFAAWEKAGDKAFVKASEQIRPRFVQCPRCSAWMCCEQCWNEKKGLCKQRAPDLGVEMAAAQADMSAQKVWAHAKMSAEDKHLTEEDWREGTTASCPKCGAPKATNAKSSAPRAAPTSRRPPTAPSAAPSCSPERGSTTSAARMRAEFRSQTTSSAATGR